MNNPDGDDDYVLESKLNKIRVHRTLGLANQKQLALILDAVDENIDEQKGDKNAVGYFVSFLLVLGQAVDDERIVDQLLAALAAYFLDLVLPHTPPTLLKAKFQEILIKLAPALSNPDAEAPLVRLVLGALESLLLAQDHKQWTATLALTLPKRALVGLLEMLFDPRPKVRKRAQEAVHKVLTNPPPLPLPVHVAAPVACDISLTKLAQLLAETKNHKGGLKELNAQLIHCLQLIASITGANAWPLTKVPELCDVLLEILKTLDQYLVLAAFSAFEGLFQLMTSDVDVDKLTTLLDVIFDLKPQVNDYHLAALWLAVVAKALQSYAQLAPEQCVAKLPKLLPVVSKFLEADRADVYTLAAQCMIAIITQTIPDAWLLEPMTELTEETITFIAEHLHLLLDVRYQHAFKDVLEVVTATLLKLRMRANPDFLDIVEVVGLWRTNEAEDFPYNKEAEDVIAAAISQIGPQAVLSVLPLNLTGNAKGPGRAWMLPILRDNVRAADLGFYIKDIMPVVPFFEEKAQQSQKHAQIFKTIIDQVWSLLPHFCDLPMDLQSLFTADFALSLAETMYAKVDLRVFICHALRMLVELNRAYADGALADDPLMLQQFPQAEAEANVTYLAQMALNLLLVLFNVFALTAPEARGFVLETIDAYLAIIPKQELELTFDTVCGMLKQAMDDNDEKLALTMMDLVVALARYVPLLSHGALFAIFTSTVNLPAAPMQKRANRILTKLGETDDGKQAILLFIGDIERVLVELQAQAQAASRAARLAAVLVVVQLLPASELWFIPAMLQEVIMSTKDVNEKSRELAFLILVTMARKCEEFNGTEIDNTKVLGEGAEPTTASIQEYLTMVSAGLAAQNALMILATITALSCLVFEFKDDLPTETLVEISSTIELFLTHNSREIAKLAIGFVKVEVLSLPEDMVRANLHELLLKLMRWSHEHSGHFKLKVKHIIERLIRKFGVEAVEQAIPEEDRKLVANIKKLRARDKRKEAAETEATAAGTKKFVSAYEEALYDSEELEAEDDGEDENDKLRRGTKYIMETGDEPLDLLDRLAIAQISLSKPKLAKREIKAKTKEFKSKNGRLVFSEESGAGGASDPLAALGLGIDAYLDAVKQAPVRGQKNKLKWKKGGDEEVDWDDDPAPKVAAKTKSNKIGKPQQKKQKFKARKKL